MWSLLMETVLAYL